MGIQSDIALVIGTGIILFCAYVMWDDGHPCFDDVFKWL